MINFLIVQVRLGNLTPEQVPIAYREAVLVALTDA